MRIIVQFHSVGFPVFKDLGLMSTWVHSAKSLLAVGDP